MLVECQNCGRSVAGEVLAQYAFRDQISGGAHQRLTLVRCPRCTRGLLFRDEEVWDDAWSVPTLVYPSASDDPIHPELPNDLRAALREAYGCIRGGAFAASALMCRKALEVLCGLHGASTGNLARSIQQLKESGHIDGRLYERADALRIAGNQAAHNADVNISAEDARDLLEFTTAITEYTMIVSDRFDRFKRRRAGGGSPPQ